MSANHENMETIERKGDRKVKKISKIITVSAVVAVLGFGANTFAHMGKGYDSSGRGNSGPGWNHNRDYGGSGYGHMMGDLNNDEIKRLDEERGAFFKATENTRQEIYQKELALEGELAKENPDARAATGLQKEISGLRAELDTMRIDHMIKVRGIVPDAGRGFMGRGRMMGGGPGYGGGCQR